MFTLFDLVLSIKFIILIIVPTCMIDTTSLLETQTVYNFAVFKGRIHSVLQGLHRLEKYLNLEGFLEKSLKIKS